MESNGAEMGEVLHRGRLYERYSEKREAKLREEWFLRTEQKEAEMRAMWDRFERIRPPSSRREKSRPSDLHSGCITRQKITRSVQEERRTITAARRNSTIDQSTFSMPLTTKDNLTISSSPSSPKSLSRSRTINEEQMKSKPVRSHHRRSTLAAFSGIEWDNNSYSDCSKPFLKKGTGIGPGTGTARANQRTSKGNEQRHSDCSFENGDFSSSQEFLVPSGTSSTSSGSDSADNCSIKEVREVHVIRERKKWSTPVKPLMFTSESQKDGTRGLKKLLLNIVGKTKTRETSQCLTPRSIEIGK